MSVPQAIALGFLVGVAVACVAYVLWRLMEQEDEWWRQQRW